MEGAPVQCNYCDTQCSKFSNLKRHVRNKHNIELTSVKRRKLEGDESNQTNVTTIKQYKCSICDVLDTKQKLDLHYVEAHQVDLKIENIKFINVINFHDWKSAIEKENHCRYVATCGRKANVERYICHRSGEFKSKSKGLRSLKRQGSKKIGSYCPSKMVVYKVGDVCEVKFYKTHVGHDNELCHLTLPSEIRAKIAHRLLQKVPPVIVLEEIKNSVGKNNERIHLLNMKDMHNIAKEFKISYDATEHNNNVDISSLIEDLMNISTDATILYHKPHGIADEDLKQLTSDDFLLITMNQTQHDLYHLFSKNIIIIDRTWKISYNLHLITLLVLDETFQAFPCCFIFSNKDDESRLETIFSILRSKTSSTATKLLMTCISEQYCNAWTNVMGAPEHHLFSPWNVNQSWNLNTAKIKDSEKLAHVTEMLKRLFDEPDTKKFPHLLNKAVEYITGEGETRQFGQYFCRYFLREVVKWARCYQLQLGLKDTSDLESACKMIKCIYYNIKKSGGLGDCILFLFRFLRDKLFTKRVNYSEKEIRRQQQCLKKSHSISISKDYSITTNESESWLVTSSVEKSVNEIKINNANCQCEINCDICASCIHHYVCSCANSSIDWNMCHHIHYLCANLQITGSENIIVVDDTVTFANDSVSDFSESDMNYFANDDHYDDDDDEDDVEDDDEHIAITVPENLSDINAVLEINSLMDEIIMRMTQTDEGSDFVIRSLKNILNALKPTSIDPLDNIVID